MQSINRELGWEEPGVFSAPSDDLDIDAELALEDESYTDPMALAYLTEGQIAGILDNLDLMDIDLPEDLRKAKLEVKPVYKIVKTGVFTSKKIIVAYDHYVDGRHFERVGVDHAHGVLKP